MIIHMRWAVLLRAVTAEVCPVVLMAEVQAMVEAMEVQAMAEVHLAAMALVP